MSGKIGFASGILFPFPLVFGGLLPPAMGVARLQDGTVVAGRDFLVWEGAPGVLRASDIGCDRLFGAASSPDYCRVAVWAGSDSTGCIVVLDEDSLSVLGPYESAGLPCWDGEGNLWFTARETLHCNGEPVGPPLSAHHISVSQDGKTVVFTDENDFILEMNLESARLDTISTSFRFYAPFYIPGGGIVSASLDGGIWLFENMRAVPVGQGEHPAWWPEAGGIVYIQSTDDGMYMTSSDIWLWTPGSGAAQLSDTPYIFEINPVPAPDGVYYIDSFSGLVGFLEMMP